MKALEGKSALVTGGGGGFGKAIALELSKDGALVTLMGRSRQRLQDAKAYLEGEVAGARIAICAADNETNEGTAAAVDATIAHGGAIDIAVSTVGGGKGFGHVFDQSLDDFMSGYLLNVGSAFLVLKHAGPRMKPGSSVVFISSTAAQLAFNGLSSYCAAKAGLDALMRTAANELGPRGIRVNSVRPGLTHTDGMDAAFQRPGYTDAFLPFIPLGRTGIPSNVAKAVRYFAGPESDWTTGQSFAVDGGNETRMAPTLIKLEA